MNANYQMKPKSTLCFCRTTPPRSRSTRRRNGNGRVYYSYAMNVYPDTYGSQGGDGFFMNIWEAEAAM